MNKILLTLTVCIIMLSIYLLTLGEDPKPEFDLSLDKFISTKKKSVSKPLESIKLPEKEIPVQPYIKDLSLVANVQEVKLSDKPHKYFVKSTPYPSAPKVPVLPVYISDEVAQSIVDIEEEIGIMTKAHWRAQHERNKSQTDRYYDVDIPAEVVNYEKKLKELKKKIEDMKKANNINRQDWSNKERCIQLRRDLDKLNSKINAADPADEKYDSIIKRFKKIIKTKEAVLEKTEKLLGVEK